MKKVITGIRMRKCFADTLCRRMATNDKIWVVTADLGYKMWDEIKINYPDRFINVGAAEQALIGVGIGLALEGMIPFVYSITSFLLYRPFESIRNYINQERIPVKLIGSGRGRDYLHDGFSHWAEEDKEIMKILKNIKARWPNTNAEIPALVDEMLKDKSPHYVNLRK